MAEYAAKQEVEVVRVEDQRERAVQRLDRLATLMDTSVQIPGTTFRVGLDPIIGLIPGVGVAVTPGVGRTVLGRMAGNILVDALVGSIPLLGDIFDAWFKANTRNIRILRNVLALPYADKTPA